MGVTHERGANRAGALLGASVRCIVGMLFALSEDSGSFCVCAPGQNSSEATPVAFCPGHSAAFQTVDSPEGGAECERRCIYLIC